MSLFGTPAPASSAGGFSFGAPAAATPAPAPGGGFSFGAAPAPAVPGTSIFGAPQPAAAAPASTFGGFGTSATPAPSPSTFGGAFGAPAATAPAPSGFGGLFGAPTPAPSAFGSAFGAAAASPAPGVAGSLFGATPAVVAAAAQPQGITPETRYADLPEDARRKIDELAKEIKRQRAVADEVHRTNPMHGLGLQTDIQQLRRDLQAFLNEQEKQKLAMKDLRGDADLTMKQAEVHGQFVVQRMRSDSGLNTVEQLPSDYMWDLVENFEKRLLEYAKEINAIQEQLSEEPLQGGGAAAAAATGPYGQRTRVTPERLALVIKEQWKTFNQLAGHAAVAHEQIEALRQQYKQQFKTDPFEAADREERNAQRRLLRKQMQQAAPPPAPAPASVAAAAALAAPAPAFGAAPATSAFGSTFGNAPAPATSTLGGGLGGGGAFGKAPSPAAGGLFGAAAPAPSATGFGFGAPAPTPATTGFSFGAPAPAAPAPAPGGGLFGGTSTFGATPAPAPAGGLFGAASAPAPTPAGGVFGSAFASAAPALAPASTLTKKKNKGRSRRGHY